MHIILYMWLQVYAFEISCSAPHALLAMGKVDPLHPDLAVDPLTILRPHMKLNHQLPLVIYHIHMNETILKRLIDLHFPFSFGILERKKNGK